MMRPLLLLILANELRGAVTVALLLSSGGHQIARYAALVQHAVGGIG